MSATLRARDRALADEHDCGIFADERTRRKAHARALNVMAGL